MGICGGHIKEYTDTEFEEEIELRTFEQEMGANKRNFSEVLNKIFTDKEFIKNSNLFKETIVNEFSENFFKLINSNYFIKEVNNEKLFITRKLIILIFLFTRPKVLKNSLTEYHDKTNFLFSIVKSKEDNKLLDPLEVADESFLNFLSDLIEISCEVIVDFFYTLKGIQFEKEAKKLSANKKPIVDSLIKFMFTQNKEALSGCLSFEELDLKFEKIQFFLTSGYLRELGLKQVQNGESVQNPPKKEVELKQIDKKP